MKSPFKTLFIREIQGAIIDFRFWVVLVLCLSIIPLSFYVSVKNYSQRLSDYQQEVQTYRDNTHIHTTFVAQGVHPPSPLSIFSQGLNNKLPYKVFTSRDGDFKIEYAKPDNKKDLMGEIDFAFIVSFVLSLLAIVFTFSSISGDKESGVMRLVLSNPVLRRQFLFAKLAGNSVIFLLPFLLSILMALVVVYVSGVIPIFSEGLLLPALIMLGVSVLFILVMFNLGLLISAFTQNSILSVNVLLLIWIVLCLVIPKSSPIISAVVYPVESTSVFESKRMLLRKSITNEQEKEEIDLYERIRDQLRPGSDGISTGWTDVNEAYDEQVVPVRERYEKLLAYETERLTNDYSMRCDKQNRIARSIASISPIYIANSLMAEFSNTGYLEIANFTKQAALYQSSVKQNYYDKMPYKTYRSTSGWATTGTKHADDLPTELPSFEDYKSMSVGQVFQENWVDFALLGFYCLLFFLCSFVSFLRFDVR